MTIGENILRLRKQKGLSQEDLAEKLYVSRQSVSLWETNQTVPQIDYLIEISKIFNVSLDELCNCETINSTNSSVEPKEDIQTPIHTTHFEYDNTKIKKLINILDKRIHIRVALLTNLIVLGLFFVILEDLSNLILLFVVLNILLIIFFKVLNKKSKNILINEQRTIDVNFYEDYFISQIKTINSVIESKIKYNEIKKLYIDDEMIVIVFNNKYAVLEQSSLKENKDIIISKLKLKSTSTVNLTTNQKNNQKLKAISIILFVSSLASIFLAAFLMGIVSSTSKYSFAPTVFVLNMWLFYICSIIPLGSLIFGIIVNRRIKCKKNIIAGAIMTAILVIYGSFSIIFRPFFSFDKTYLNELSNEINIVFPNEYLIVTEKLSIYNETHVKFENEEEIINFEKSLENSTLWQKSENLPTDLEISILMQTKYNDYFYIYELNNQNSNSFTDRNVKEILLSYNTNTNVLLIYEIIETDSN